MCVYTECDHKNKTLRKFKYIIFETTSIGIFDHPVRIVSAVKLNLFRLFNSTMAAAADEMDFIKYNILLCRCTPVYNIGIIQCAYARNFPRRLHTVKFNGRL